jgi:serine/threonine-protein kinase
MAFLLGQERVVAAGFDVHVDDKTTTTAGLSCGKITQTVPNGGVALEVTKPVKLVVIDGVCESSSMSPSPTATSKP